MSGKAPAERVLQSDRPSSVGDAFDGQRPPPIVPDHELIRPIGEGSYGAVWLARNVMGTYRAVKVVYRKDFANEKPFQREFNGIQKFEPISRSHDGFVDVLQIGRSDTGDYFYYVMELADDAKSRPLTEAYCPKTLRSEIEQRGRLPAGECAQIGLTLSSALEHLHQNGLVHRDIKPSNIIFVNSQPKLADIGLVAEVNEARSFVGTEGFIPPEGPGTPQADIYSLGKVLYEISSGKDRHAFPEPPTRLAEFADQEELLELDEVIQRACESDPRRRYISAQQMYDDLLLLRAGKSVRQLHIAQRRLAVATRIGLAAGIVALLAVGGYFLARNQARHAREQARRETELRQKAEASEKKAETEAAKARQISKFLQDMLKNASPWIAMGEDTKLLRRILDNTMERVGKDLKDQPGAQAEILDMLGRVQSALGQYDKAVALYCEAVALQRKLRGNDHELVADALDRLGYALWKCGKWAEAEAVLRETLASKRRLYGEQHRSVANPLLNLSMVLKDRGKIAEAESAIREALAIHRKSPSEKPLHAVHCLAILGGVLERQGKWDEAESITREVIASFRKILGEESPDVGNSLNFLSYLLLRRGDATEAEKCAHESLAMQRKFLPPTHPYFMESLDGLRGVLNRQGKFAEAEPLLREALAIREKVAPDDWQTFRRKSELADNLLKQDKYAEAESLLLSAYEGLKQREAKIPKPKACLKDAARRLAKVYECLNCPDEAAEWERKVAEFDGGITGNKVALSQPEPAR